MINDILDLSQIKEKKLRLVYQSEDIKETIQSAVQLVELQAQKKGIDLVLELDPNLPAQFCTDHMRLSQILLNLLSNAIKFTSEGSVKLSTVYMQTSQWVKISVEDTGIGMSQENVKKLFTNYTHIEFAGRQTMNPTGVGLGLNIAYRLVKLLAPSGHKTIVVKSLSNKGSTFSLVLENQEQPEESQYLEDLNNSLKIADELPGVIKPLLFSKLKTNSSHSESLLNSPCGCPKVLVVDDNPFNIMAFETILGSLNIQCDSVYSGPAALKKLSRKCGKDCKGYAVVFMDQEMPEMNGIQTVKEIRRLQKEEGVLAQELKIIGCTAHKSKEEVERFLEAGLDQCIHKPISVGMIKDIL